MKYKVIPQIGQEDCGAACVAMIIENYFKKKISVCEIRPLIKNTSLGTSFYDLRRGLKYLGIDSTISQAVKQKEVFNEITYPFITQISNDAGIHYVVVFKKKNNRLIIGDSSTNKQESISINKFMKIWIPYVLTINLSSSKINYEIEQNVQEISIWRIMKLIKWQLILSFIISIIVFIIGVVLASLYTLYFNILIPQNLGELALQLMMVYIIINIVNFALSYINNLIYNSMSNKIDKKIIGTYFRGLLEKPNMAIESYEIGELLTNLSNIIMIRQRFLTYLQVLPLSILTMCCSFYLLYISDQKLSIFVILLIITLGLIIYLSDSYYERLSKELIETGEEFNESTIDIFSNVSIIKQLSLEKEFGNRGIKKLTQYIGSRTKMFNFDSMQDQLKTFVLSTFNIALFSMGVYLITKNQLSSGVLLTFNALLAYVTNPILTIANLQSAIVQGKVAQDKLYNILESRIKLFGDEELKLEDGEISIDFNNISFDYDLNSKIFENTSVTFNGHNIAISGLNGVGKSTIGKLISRLYIPDSGIIEINGQNLTDISEESISENIIYVDGRENLFSSSVIDNIKLGRNIEDKKILEILDTINAKSIFMNHDFDKIQDTQLSLGQMQIIKVLRSTLIQKKIYIFDEITNGLEERLKSSVIDYLFKLDGIKFFITHDKEVIKACEQEYEVDNSLVVKRR
ncbi:cysteine peptidase family C39 domain-containing protein [Enterococcus sp. RIT-PI-f]|uniref:cysteine peptidase family C39 domain-containing protein n=1 Tax=Enterococcus sp. RIT-PI-f TaxID=1690244 RepID=UPI003561E149